MRRSLLTLTCCALAWPADAQSPQQAVPVVVASKPFGESYLLAEMFAQLLESRGMRVVRRSGLGGTEILMQGLRANVIDVYPEYTGTGLIAVLHDSVITDPRAAFTRVSQRFDQEYGLRWLPPLGFENTYAIAVRAETADRERLRTLSDLVRASERLNAGFTPDFIGRSDGLPGLSKAYGMRFRAVRPLAPALKYQALAERGVDVIDGYSTDGLLARYNVSVLEDDRRFFPPYEAAALISARLARERPDAIAVLTLLSGRLDVTHMRGWNRRVEVDGEPIADVARDALRDALGAQFAGRRAGDAREKPGVRSSLAPMSRVARLTVRHVLLVLVGLLSAILVAVPLGLVLERARGAAEGTIASLGVLQTIPSIALLAFMIPLFGVGLVPALVALWLYALYPIARSTYVGVRDADPEAVQAAEALGTTARQRLLWVRLPLAAPVIMTGVRTAAVITVGAATLAALIGAGGLGEPIVEGLALADTRLILSGAIPAAVLALVVDVALSLLERRVRPAHFREPKGASDDGGRARGYIGTT